MKYFIMHAIRIDLEDGLSGRSYSAYNDQDLSTRSPSTHSGHDKSKGENFISFLKCNTDTRQHGFATRHDDTKSGYLISSLKCNEEIDKRHDFTARPGTRHEAESEGSFISSLKCNDEIESRHAITRASAIVDHHDVVRSSKREHQRNHDHNQDMITMESFNFVDNDGGSVLTDVSSSYNGTDIDSGSGWATHNKKNDYTVSLQLENETKSHIKSDIPRETQEAGLSYRLVSTGENNVRKKNDQNGNFLFQQVIATDSPRNHIFMRNYSPDDGFADVIIPPGTSTHRPKSRAQTTMQSTQTENTPSRATTTNQRQESVQVHRPHSDIYARPVPKDLRVRNVVMQGRLVRNSGQQSVVIQYVPLSGKSP